jgi:hypothetical protein
VPAERNARSRVRKQFNTLIKKTEAARLLLASWKESMPAIMAEAERELHPLLDDYMAHQRRKLLLLDHMHRESIKAKRERAKLSKLIYSIALDLLAGSDDPEVKAIHDRHSIVGDDGVRDADAFREMMAAALGVEIHEVSDMFPPADLFAGHEDDEDDGDGEEAAAGARASRSEPGARRKSAAALAREQKQANEAAKLRQSVRDIFRKLTSALHPDRELDAAERARKTELMQRVTVAYKTNDLLALLELQLESEQIGQADLNGLSDERVAHYNKILSGRLREIEAEIAVFEDEAWRQSGGLLLRPTPKALLRRLRVDIAEMRAQLKTLAAELEAFKDVATLRAWLKAWRAPRTYDDGLRF